MKKIITIFIMFFTMFLIVDAEKLDEYELKWTEEIQNSGYTYNPYM